jgi:hypothetical protein
MESRRVPGFGQADPTDDRDFLDWKSKYSDPAARQGIRFEAIYLATLLVLVPVAMVLLRLEYPKHWLRLSDESYKPIVHFGMAWLGGVLGGTLFDLKWLYHSVARQLWHLDRRLWRLFTPHISGGLAFAMVVLISSGLVRIFDSRAMNSLSSVVGISFLVGYFSDSAIAKLTEVAETLFGTSRGKEKHKEPVLPTSREESKTSPKLP